jgi:hypothetical protein
MRVKVRTKLSVVMIIGASKPDETRGELCSFIIAPGATAPVPAEPPT